MHPIGADALKPVVDAHLARGKAFKLAMVHPTSTHNYELRYWLAAGGIHPGLYDAGRPDAKARTGWIDAEAKLYVAPPPQMPRQLADGRVHGYCVGEPWNQRAVADGAGVPVVTDHDIWQFNPEKVFGVSAAFAEANPNTTVRLVRALLRAGKWLDANANANRAEAVDILAQAQYVGAPPAVLAASMTGTFEYEPGDVRPKRRTSTSSSATSRPTPTPPTRCGSSPRCAAGARLPRRAPTPGTWRPREASTGPTSTPSRPGS